MTDNAVVTPVPAATILMLRDGEQGLEVFMVVRHRQNIAKLLAGKESRIGEKKKV